jgi:hypothetical protein
MLKIAVAVLSLTVPAAADPGSGAAGGDWATWCAFRIDQARAQVGEGEPRYRDARVTISEDRSDVGLDDGAVWVVDRMTVSEGISARSWFGDPDWIYLAKNGRSGMVHSTSVEPDRVKRFMEKMRAAVDDCLSDPVDGARRYTAEGKVVARNCPWKTRPLHLRVRIALDEKWLVADTGTDGLDHYYGSEGHLVFRRETLQGYDEDQDQWTLRSEPNGVLNGDLRRGHKTWALDHPCQERFEIRMTPDHRL